jgi:hypothetical protein
MNWGPVFQEMTNKSQLSMHLLAIEVLPKFLNSKLASGLISKIRAREIAGQTGPLFTVAKGLDKTSEMYWLDMFRIMSETINIGMVISDMTVPGCPLIYINEGISYIPYPLTHAL